MSCAMRIRVNGKDRPLPSVPTVEGLLAELSLDPRWVIVERNGEILPRETAPAAPLRPGDAVEIVQAVAGG